MPSILWLVLLVVLIIMLLPSWPYSQGFGWYPSGGLSVILLILLILLLFGRR